MNIHLKFDDELIEKYSSKPSGDILMGICIEHNGEFYPSDDWLDFGNVILGWWSYSLSEILQGREGQGIDFMDGPFFISTKLDQEILSLRSEDGYLSWDLDRVQLAKEIARATNEVSRKFHCLELFDLSERMNGSTNLLETTLKLVGAE